jgi:hypothetical protein
MFKIQLSISTSHWLHNCKLCLKHNLTYFSLQNACFYFQKTMLWAAMLNFLLSTDTEKRNQNENIHFNFEIDAFAESDDKFVLETWSIIRETFFCSVFFKNKPKNCYRNSSQSNAMTCEVFTYLCFLIFSLKSSTNQKLFYTKMSLFSITCFFSLTSSIPGKAHFKDLKNLVVCNAQGDENL